MENPNVEESDDNSVEDPFANSDFILHYCKHFVGTKKVIMYSDQCGDQNRNIKMSLISDYITTSSALSITEINHKFLISGHSYFPGDQDIGVIEKEKKFHKDVYVPDYWTKVIESARKRNPFRTIKMTKNYFYSTEGLENAITNRKPDEQGGKVECMRMQWIRYNSETKHRFQFKYSNSRDTLFPVIENLQLLYPNGKPIEIRKMKNLHELLPYVLLIYQIFYNGLRTAASAQDDYAENRDFPD